jgi:hypothetical protein
LRSLSRNSAYAAAELLPPTSVTLNMGFHLVNPDDEKYFYNCCVDIGHGDILES